LDLLVILALLVKTVKMDTPVHLDLRDWWAHLVLLVTMVVPVKTAKMVTLEDQDRLGLLDRLDLPAILVKLEDLVLLVTMDCQEKMAKTATLEVPAKMVRTDILVDQVLRETLEPPATMEHQARTDIQEDLDPRDKLDYLAITEVLVRMEHPEHQATYLAQLDLLVLQV